MDDTLDIQVQEVTGDWLTVGHSQNEPQQLEIAFKNTELAWPKYRISAVTKSGSLVDLR